VCALISHLSFVSAAYPNIWNFSTITSSSRSAALLCEVPHLYLHLPCISILFARSFFLNNLLSAMLFRSNYNCDYRDYTTSYAQHKEVCRGHCHLQIKPLWAMGNISIVRLFIKPAYFSGAAPEVGLFGLPNANLLVFVEQQITFTSSSQHHQNTEAEN